MRGKREELHQVFLSTLANAIEAVEEKGESQGGKVEVHGFPDNGRYVVIIKDTGVGIPEKLLPYIFDPFFTTKPYPKGTGLGLTIAQSVIKMMGGSIHVNSEQGKGTELKIEIPLEGES